MVVRLCIAGASGASVFFGLETCCECCVGFGVGGVVWVGFSVGEGGAASAAAGVAWWWAGWGGGVGGVDGFGGFVPLGFFGVDVYVEPGSRVS